MYLFILNYYQAFPPVLGCFLCVVDLILVLVGVSPLNSWPVSFWICCHVLHHCFLGLLYTPLCWNFTYSCIQFCFGVVHSSPWQHLLSVKVKHACFFTRRSSKTSSLLPWLVFPSVSSTSRLTSSRLYHFICSDAAEHTLSCRLFLRYLLFIQVSSLLSAFPVTSQACLCCWSHQRFG